MTEKHCIRVCSAFEGVVALSSAVARSCAMVQAVGLVLGSRTCWMWSVRLKTAVRQRASCRGGAWKNEACGSQGPRLQKEVGEGR